MCNTWLTRFFQTTAVLSSAISCHSSICPGCLSTPWLVPLVVFSCHMVFKWWRARSIGRLWGGWYALPRIISFFSHCWFKYVRWAYFFPSLFCACLVSVQVMPSRGYKTRYHVPLYCYLTTSLYLCWPGRRRQTEQWESGTHLPLLLNCLTLLPTNCTLLSPSLVYKALSLNHGFSNNFTCFFF